MSPEVVSYEETMGRLLKLIGRRAVMLEVGFQVDGDDPDRDPEPGEEVGYWAKAQRRSDSGFVFAEHRDADPQVGMPTVLAELAKELGFKVRVRFKDVP